MNKNNSKNVTLNITSTMKDIGHYMEKKTTAHIGKLYEKDGKIYIFYSDEENSKVKLTIDNDIFTIKHEGYLTYKLEFQDKNQTSSSIKTELFGFEVKIITKKLDIKIDEDEIVVKLDYEIINNNEIFLVCNYIFLIR